ncbi:glutamine synthetase family protein [Embleya hyalina]|uniref:Glutamine synthetase n=1 Tax=Embleya hyalina TaxID=516124 RepID=A0A401YSY7_9ACTN|nr:glutamine synthetase family protein [Embleya hyalina]GCD97737.1 glutamine synthetase [Embleya hyalina]
MTDRTDCSELDRHRELNTDETAVRKLRDLVTEARVEFVHCQAVTLTGRVVGKVVPAAHLTRTIETGVRAHRAILADMRTDVNGTLLGGGCEAREYTAMPDLDTFAVLPWDTRAGRFFCRLYEPAHLPDGVGGGPLATDVRGNLRRRHTAFTARTGLELRSGCEPEASWSGPHLDAARPPISPIHHIDSMDAFRPVYQRLITYGQALGLDMIEANHEGDPGQLEPNCMFDRADRTADNVIVHRQICRQVARELGLTVNFMPKPADHHTGNSCQHNLSLWRDGTNVLADPGARGLRLSEIGRHALGGILTHAAAATAVLGPTVNSYKRFVQPSPFTPSRADWGRDDRTCAVRLPDGDRLEVRIPDAMVNPYLSHAVLLAAIEDGLKNRIDPGPARGTSDPRRDTRFPELPTTLDEALRAFTADPVITGGLGSEISELFRAIKADEWTRFCRAVTDWEQTAYADQGC